MPSIDFESANTGPDDNQIKVIAGLAAKQRKLERELAEAEASKKLIEKNLFKVMAIDLPDAMKAAGCTSFKLVTGEAIEVVEGISASVSKDRKPMVCKWLRENGAGDLVSEEISISYGRGKEEAAAQLVEELIDKGLVPIVTTEVNTGTLKAWVKEQKKDGKDLPLDLLGVTEWKKAVITPPKS